MTAMTCIHGDRGAYLPVKVLAHAYPDDFVEPGNLRPQEDLCQSKKNPALGGASLDSSLNQTFFLRLANPIPNRPIPRSARVPGSGTLTTMLSSAN